MITLTASAAYGFGGKQFIARVTGRNSKYTFEREFVGRKGGKRNESCEADIDEPGLYEARSIDKHGSPDDAYVLVIDCGGSLRKFGAGKEDAMKIAKALDDGRPFAEVVTGCPADPKAVEVAQALKSHQRQLGHSLSEHELAQTYGLMDDLDGLPKGVYPRPQVEAARRATIARLEAELAALAAAGKSPTSRYEILSPKVAAAKQAAQTVESAVEACMAVLSALPEKEAKKVLAALKVRVSPPKPAKNEPIPSPAVAAG